MQKLISLFNFKDFNMIKIKVDIIVLFKFNGFQPTWRRVHHWAFHHMQLARVRLHDHRFLLRATSLAVPKAKERESCQGDGSADRTSRFLLERCFLLFPFVLGHHRPSCLEGLHQQKWVRRGQPEWPGGYLRLHAEESVWKEIEVISWRATAALPTRGGRLHCSKNWIESQNNVWGLWGVYG